MGMGRARHFSLAVLMVAVGSRDGREIVRKLDTLRNQGLTRDEDGRYVLPAKG